MNISNSSKSINNNINVLHTDIKRVIKNTNYGIDVKITEGLKILYNILIICKVIYSTLVGIIQHNIKYQNKYKNQLDDIINDFSTLNTDLQTTYNSYLESKKKNNKIHYSDIIKGYEKHKTHILKRHTTTLVDNLDIEDIDVLLNKIKPITNGVKFGDVDIGFGNIYQFHIYDTLSDDIPLNLMVYVKELDQVVIKIGTETNYKYVNSKLYKVYNSRDKLNNNRSIICNNNIKAKNKQCLNGEACNYYHDPIIGYKEDAHSFRQFSSNPIIYNCVDFKNGENVKENIEKIQWYDAINLYQASLSVVLIACLHSKNN